LPGGEDIVDIPIGQLGKISKITLFRNNPQNLDAKGIFLGDKAYIGEEFIITPYKSPKKSGSFRDSKKRKYHQEELVLNISYVICRVKTFRVASDRFPLGGHRYNPMIMVVCGLVSLDLNYSFILSHHL
jgi:hypothetical protein